MFNKFLELIQSKSNYLYENSLLLKNIDKLVFLSIILVFVSSTVMSSDFIGFVALISVLLSFIRILIKPNEKIELKTFEIWLLAYFMIVVVSLAGSTLFHLSLKGFLKTFTYITFYLSTAQYLKNNKDKIPYILGTIGLCVSFEAIAGLLQNFAKVSEISTWQDVSNLNPEQVMTRVYGTLKPLNPNLLGGYFVAGIPALYGISAYLYMSLRGADFHINEKADVHLSQAMEPSSNSGLSRSLSSLAITVNSTFGMIITLIFAVLSTVVLFLTGCRGSYIGMFVIFCEVFAVSAKFLWENFKTAYLSIVGSVIAISTIIFMAVSSLRARILSIFAMRQDSSNSFRFNVYQSSLDMFKDNWLVGIGVGNLNFREIYGLYMRTGFDALSTYNIYLEVAVESGIFALIAFVGFLISLIKDSIKFILKSTDNKSVIVVSAALISICAVCVHGFVDTVFFRPQIQFIFWTMVAIVKNYI